MYTYTVDRLCNIADDRFEEAEVFLQPLLPLTQFWVTVTTLLLVNTGVGVSQGLEPPLKVIVLPPHDIGVILPELCLPVHPLVVSILDVQNEGVLVEEI